MLVPTANDGVAAPLVDSAAPLGERIAAVREFTELASRMFVVGHLEWNNVENDFRLLAVNSAMRRQLESMRAAVLLSSQDLGHLAVAFVRASLEDVMYLGFFISLEREASQELFLLLGNWDSLRSLLAQRAYVGDDVMRSLWYPEGFLDAADKKREEVRLELKALQKHYRWAGFLPSSEWIADRAGQRPLYDYLHAATSRSLHFSAGEIMRRAWGEPDGSMTTEEPEFREHLAAFALDQLVRLYAETWQVAMPVIEQSGISSDESLDWDDVEPALSRVSALGKVPLVHAHEWNLTPGGPLRLRPPKPGAAGP